MATGEAGTGLGGPGEITDLLSRWRGGDQAAFAILAPLVYDELRRLARGSLRGRGAGRTLQPTAMVHELFLRLLGRPAVTISDRRHFFALAAKMLRQILIDQARVRDAEKRGGGAVAVDLAEVAVAVAPPAVDLLDLDRALTRLREHDEQLERLVELRYFGGLTLEESADVMERSEASISRDWVVARAFLFRELGGPSGRERPAP
jgi:RNA polymerase sigma factor (TIGR02999 family)